MKYKVDYYKKFITTSAEERLSEFRNQDDSYWKKKGEQMALNLFHEAASRVPAYKNYLKNHKVNSRNIKTISDLKKVPLTDKTSYINKYKLNDLCWDGRIGSSYFISASSGSTGVPNYWPRSTEQTFQGASISELIYKDFFNADKKSTLYIIAFGMGMWIAGTYMMMSTEWVAQKGFPIAIATPGLNREEIIRLVELGNKSYEQIILVGYPPFIKDVMDFGSEKGVEWGEINIKFLFTGEAFTERWREYIFKKAKTKNKLTDAINIYGSADVGLVAHETPLTNFIRNKAAHNSDLMREFFNAERVPSVNQFDPQIRYFERIENELVVTAPSGVPLVRYNTKDVGDILYYEDLRDSAMKFGLDIEKEFKDKNISNLLWKTPIVYLFGRGKFTATIYGITVFPEYVKYILDNDVLIEKVSGKYNISSEETKNHDQSLHLRVELKENVQKSSLLAKKVREVFVSELPKISTEYNHLLSAISEKAHPVVHLHDYGDPEYFPRGVIKKNA